MTAVLTREQARSVSPETAALAVWLANHHGTRTGLGEFLAELASRLIALGVPMLRVSITLNDFHPEVVGRSYAWNRVAGTEEVDRRYTPKRNEAYWDSPIRVIHEGATAVRRRLEGDDAVLDFQVTRELKDQGATDYAGMELAFSDGSRQFISFATDRSGGFTTGHLSLLDGLLPFISLRIEIEHARRGTEQLLSTYLGIDAARRVIGGTIRRNTGEAIEAIVLASDLRGFTRLADTLPAQDVIEALGEFFEAVAGPVRRHGGDIVKMVGDGILAIFPLTDRSSEGDVSAALSAMDAVREALATLETLPPESLPSGVQQLRAGFALHVGPVTFGNVGSKDRLDFTVIGLAVNEAFRLEAMTKALGTPILVSSSFAELANNDGLRSLGFHALRGVRDAKEVFTLST
jgi:adenylate cyclase